MSACCSNPADSCYGFTARLAMHEMPCCMHEPLRKLLIWICPWLCSWRFILCLCVQMAVMCDAGIFVYGYCFYYYFARSDMSGFMQTSTDFCLAGLKCRPSAASSQLQRRSSSCYTLSQQCHLSLYGSGRHAYIRDPQLAFIHIRSCSEFGNTFHKVLCSMQAFTSCTWRACALASF